jgi:hypothetical protein
VIADEGAGASPDDRDRERRAHGDIPGVVLDFAFMPGAEVESEALLRAWRRSARTPSSYINRPPYLTELPLGAYLR